MPGTQDPTPRTRTSPAATSALVTRCAPSGRTSHASWCLCDCGNRSRTPSAFPSSRRGTHHSDSLYPVRVPCSHGSDAALTHGPQRRRSGGALSRYVGSSRPHTMHGTSARRGTRRSFPRFVFLRKPGGPCQCHGRRRGGALGVTPARASRRQRARSGNSVRDGREVDRWGGHEALPGLVGGGGVVAGFVARHACCELSEGGERER